MNHIDNTLDRVLSQMVDYVNRWGLLRPKERVVVAFSGGPDSTALLLLLRELAGDWGLDLTAAHLDHGINLELGEVAWQRTQELAESLGVRWVGKRENVIQAKEAEGASLHEVGRRLRYQFFSSVAKEVGASVVATGHTADDQAETVLMRILRGSGALGASGIPPKRSHEGVTIIRPLLSHRRRDLAAFCRERGASYIEDPANAELSFLRSRVRHEVLPALEKIFGHDVVPHLAAFAERLREAQEALDDQAVSLLKSPEVTVTSTSVTFPRALLRNKPSSVQKHLLVKAFSMLRGRPPRLKALHLENFVSIESGGKDEGRVEFPEGWEASFSKTLVRIGRVPKARVPVGPVNLACPGETKVPGLGVRVRVERRPPPASLPSERAEEAYIGARAISGGLRLRPRRPGDTIVPLGAPGRRKLKKVLIDRKVPRVLRDRLPILTTGQGDDEEILWVVGVVLSEACRIEAGEAEAWHVKVEPYRA